MKKMAHFIFIISFVFIGQFLWAMGFDEAEETTESHLCVVDEIAAVDKKFVSYHTIQDAQLVSESKLSEVLKSQIKEKYLLSTQQYEGYRLYTVANSWEYKDEHEKELAQHFSDIVLIIEKDAEAKRFKFSDIKAKNGINIEFTKNPITQGYYLQTHKDNQALDFNQDGIQDIFIGIFRDKETDASSYFVLSYVDGELSFLGYDIGANWDKMSSLESAHDSSLSDYTIIPIVKDDGKAVLRQWFAEKPINDDENKIKTLFIDWEFDGIKWLSGKVQYL